MVATTAVEWPGDRTSKTARPSLTRRGRVYTSPDGDGKDANSERHCTVTCGHSALSPGCKVLASLVVLLLLQRPSSASSRLPSPPVARRLREVDDYFPVGCTREERKLFGKVKRLRFSWVYKRESIHDRPMDLRLASSLRARERTPLIFYFFLGFFISSSPFLRILASVS